MKNKTNLSSLYAFLALILAGLLLYSSGVLDSVLPNLGGFDGPMSQYDPPPPDPTRNAPGADYFDYVMTAVPTEIRDRIHLGDLFGNDVGKMNLFWSQSVYIQANTEITIVTIQRARTAGRYEALVLPLSLFGDVGQPYIVIPGTELSTIVTGDVFLVLGTTPGNVLASITKVETDDATGTINVTVAIEPSALYVGFSIAEGTNNPQVEAQTIVTPNPYLSAWLVLGDKMDPESVLVNQSLKAVSREALWLILHHDGPQLWQDFKTSVEVSNGGTSGYDLLAPYVRGAFCSKLADYQNELEAGGLSLDRWSCDNNVTVNVIFQAVMPTDDTGLLQGMQYVRMNHSGVYLQIPDPLYHVDP